MRLRFERGRPLASPRERLRYEEEEESIAKRYACIRFGLLVGWTGFSCLEAWFWWSSRWVPSVLLVTNGWGWFDAVLRYPKLHDIDSLFFVKQLLLLAAKLVLVSLDVDGIRRQPLGFLVLIFANVLLPLLYVLLLPLNQHPRLQRLAAAEVVNLDIGLRLLRFLRSPHQRRAWLARPAAWLQGRTTMSSPSEGTARFERLRPASWLQDKNTSASLLEGDSSLEAAGPKSVRVAAQPRNRCV